MVCIGYVLQSYHVHYCPRFALNWIKLRAWTLEEFDAVLMVDSDVTVVGNVTPAFSLPTPFAAVAEQDKGVISYWCVLDGLCWSTPKVLPRCNNRYSSLGRIQGGVLMLRPCKAVFDHMVSLVQGDRLLQYRNHFAEQVRTLPRTSVPTQRVHVGT